MKEIEKIQVNNIPATSAAGWTAILVDKINELVDVINKQQDIIQLLKNK